MSSIISLNNYYLVDTIIKQERFVGSFYRAMSLPNDADSDKMTTNYKNGVLSVNIPKKK